jgi:ribonucleoside-diphosphate reductase alpha chain
VWSANGTDDVITFPIEVPDGAKTKNQMPALGLLEIVKSTQQNWVNTGKRKNLCTQPWLSHNVSNTIHIKPDEWEEVTKYIYKNRKYFCGIALIPESGDKDYTQAPFCNVLTSREIVKEYGEASIWCSGLIELALQGFEKNLWTACEYLLKDKWQDAYDGNARSMIEFKSQIMLANSKLEFFQRAQKFAEKYFEGDVKRLTYCMKDVYNWKLYCDLERDFKHVDYTTMIEEQDNTKPEQEIACAGGACSI